MKAITHVLLPIAAFTIGFVVHGWLTTASGEAPPNPTEVSGAPKPNTPSLILTDLRHGNSSTAHERLSELAREDPKEFFHLLHQHPWLGESASYVSTPASTSTVAILDEAASNLKWNDESSFEALNLLQSPQLRTRAWQAYIAAAVGTVDDREIIDIALHAKQFHRSILHPLLLESVKDRPGETLKILTEKGIARDGFFELLLEAHPEKYDTLLSSLNTGDKNYTSDLFDASGIRAREAQDFDDLSASLFVLGRRGMYSADIVSWQTAIALRKATREGRASIYDGLAAQPDLVRNRALSDVGAQSTIPPDDLGTILGLVTSTPIRERILSDWIQTHPDERSNHGDWISRLPTPELQQTATRLIEQAAARNE